MMLKETFDEILQGLAEVLQSKNTTILVQNCEIESLKEKLSAAEKQIETMKGRKTSGQEIQHNN